MGDVVNVAIPARRWSRPYAVTLSNDPADANLMRKGIPYMYLQNVGTAGLVMISWEPSDDLVDIYLGTGQVIEGGIWRHAKTTGTAAGVSLRGFLGMGSYQ